MNQDVIGKALENGNWQLLQNDKWEAKWRTRNGTVTEWWTTQKTIRVNYSPTWGPRHSTPSIPSIWFLWVVIFQVRNQNKIYYSKGAINFHRSYLNWLHNWQLKSTRRSHTLKGSHSMGDGRILLKHPRDDFFKKVLSNEPNFGRIHLAGQYL